jgi:FkbM family methyltransferase
MPTATEYRKPPHLFVLLEVIRRFGILRVFIGLLRDPGSAIRFIRTGEASSFSDEEVKSVVSSSRPTIIEAGAADGSDSTVFLDLWPKAKLYCLEPHPGLFAKLENAVGSRAVCMNRVLSTRGRDEEDFYLDSGEGFSSSLLRPINHEKYFPRVGFRGKSVRVPSMTLDDLVEQHALSRIDLLWLDLQGAELMVLKEGGGRALAMTQVIHIEVARISTYENQPVLAEVKEYLCNEGFDLWKLRAPFVFGNAIFLKRQPSAPIGW